MRRAFAFLAASTAVAAFFACDDDIPNDPGRDASMIVQNAQFHRGPMPTENGGPIVRAAALLSIVEAGRANLLAAGDLGPSSNAIAIGIEGDVGYWTLLARTPSSATPTDPTWAATYGLAPILAPGSYQYVMRAVDVDGRFGPATLRPLSVTPRGAPPGTFVISLTWDSQVDLDLRVLLPTGIEMSKRHPAEYEPPPVSAGPTDPFALHDGGILDRDSNARCVADGQRAEHAVWVNRPPPGRYAIRVDTFSMCGGSSAHWRLDAMLDGNRLGSASGTATENDLRFSHGGGAGVLALEVDVP